jgi:hypothetical protein
MQKRLWWPLRRGMAVFAMARVWSQAVGKFYKFMLSMRFTNTMLQYKLYRCSTPKQSIPPSLAGDTLGWL